MSGRPHLIYVHQQHWLTALERLHPATQITVAIIAGAGLPLAVIAVASIGGSVASGLMAFALAMVTLFSQFVITVVGLVILVVVGVVAICKL